MVKNSKRYCDLCEREIAKGDRYVAVLIEREMVPVELNVPKSGLLADELGNLRIDVCLACRGIVRLSGEEAIC